MFKTSILSEYTENIHDSTEKAGPETQEPAFQNTDIFLLEIVVPRRQFNLIRPCCGSRLITYSKRFFDNLQNSRYLGIKLNCVENFIPQINSE